MSQVLGVFGLLDFTILRPVLFWGHLGTYKPFISLIFQFFSGRGEPRISETKDTESMDTRARLYSNIKVRENPCNGSQVFPWEQTDVRSERYDEANIRNFECTPKNACYVLDSTRFEHISMFLQKNFVIAWEIGQNYSPPPFRQALQ
jgi:hypothetical protein